MKLLLIEDDREIALALRQALTLTHLVTIADNGVGGIKTAKTKQFDAIVLDLHLPDMPGLEVCEILRSSDNSIPILILTGEAQVLSKIKLLDAGADDYLTKPFSLGELKARLRVLQRRKPSEIQTGRYLKTGDLDLDTKNHVATRQNQTIVLRKKEFALLERLMRQQGSVVRRPELAAHAWQGEDLPWQNTIDVHIKYLRDKIDKPFENKLIHTVHGIGYKIQDKQERSK